jgi:type I restriction enzyme M protein
MLSPQLRSKVDGLWNMFWSAGMTNPLVAIEQITYLLFLRKLENFDQVRVDSGKPSIYYKKMDRSGKKVEVDYDVCRWENIRQKPTFALLNDIVFPWLRNLEKWLKESAKAEKEKKGKNKRDEEEEEDSLAQITGRLDDAYFVLDPNKTETLSRAVQAIHDLFNSVGGSNADIMGDIFEYLLGEIQTAGKNGQFRTPRHIIRFMIELLDPQPFTNKKPTRILDPACGTGGFLVNTLIHWKRKATDNDQLRLEWDGTPHRTFGVLPKKLNPNDCFYGYDNDRTMVRIAWMNLILHDLDFPRIDQLDSLSKQLPDDLSDSFDYILANPPFTGTVDESDLSKKSSRVEWKGKSPLTTKSELLFVWLMLDLLRIGGRCAVVVPDGVLFGSTNAHRELRRKLLFENTLEGVVSLPGGVFNPYSGVKTSILIFKKVGDEPKAGREPRTKEVWFYEVTEEAKSLDQKRKDRPGQNNDLFDASEKFHSWYDVIQGSGLPKLRQEATATDYFQPEYWNERWRVIDDEFLRVFPDEESQQGHALGLHEIFTDLPRDPQDMTLFVIAAGKQLLGKVSQKLVQAAWETGAKQKTVNEQREKAVEELDKRLRKLLNELSKRNREQSILDREYDQFGPNALKQMFDELKVELHTSLETFSGKKTKAIEETDLVMDEQALDSILKCFARLDGYNICLRSVNSNRHDKKPSKADADSASDVLAWATPVRAWAKQESWIDPLKQVPEVQKPTHDAAGLVDPAYLRWLVEKCDAFQDDGTVKADYLNLLDPDCIEAADLNLSAGRHKPFVFSARQHKRPDDLIRKLDKVHEDIRNKLAALLTMVEGSA